MVFVNHQREEYLVLETEIQCHQLDVTHHSNHCIPHNESLLWTHPFQQPKSGTVYSYLVFFLILVNPHCSFVYSSYCAFALSCNDYETPSLFISVSMETFYDRNIKINFNDQ